MKTKTALKAGWKQSNNCGCDRHHNNGGGLAIVVGIAVVIGVGLG